MRKGTERVDWVTTTKDLIARPRNMYFALLNNGMQFNIDEFRHDRNAAWSYTLGYLIWQQYTE